MKHGLTTARYFKTLAASRGDTVSAAGYVEAKGWSDGQLILDQMRRRAAVPGMGTNALVNPVGLDLQAALRATALIDRLQGVRHVPARTRLLTSMGTTRAGWITQGQAIPVVAGSFTESALDVFKIGVIVVATNELLAAPGLDAEEYLGAEIVSAATLAKDDAFLIGGAPGAPAAITSTATPIASTGTTLAEVDADIKTALNAFVTAGGVMALASWICSERLGAHLGLMRGSGGELAYPLAGGRGGSLVGLPLLTTAAAAGPGGDSPGGEALVLIDGSAVTVAEDTPTLATSTKGTIAMNSQPVGSVLPPTSETTNKVSLFQAESTALRCTLSADWALRRPGLVQVIEGIQV